MSRTADSVAPPPSSSTTPQRPPRFALLIATGFGLGYLPKAPGTWGSLGGILLYFGVVAFAVLIAFLYEIGLTSIGCDRDSFDFLHTLAEALPLTCWAAVLVVGFVGTRAAGCAAKHLATPDPSAVVIDEICGQLLTFVLAGTAIFFSLWPLPALDELLRWKYLVFGFILFRVFDIWKPWPVRQAEKLPGGWGIMADDWVAGIYAALCLCVLRAAGI